MGDSITNYIGKFLDPLEFSGCREWGDNTDTKIATTVASFVFGAITAGLFHGLFALCSYCTPNDGQPSRNENLPFVPDYQSLRSDSAPINATKPPENPETVTIELPNTTEKKAEDKRNELTLKQKDLVSKNENFNRDLEAKQNAILIQQRHMQDDTDMITLFQEQIDKNREELDTLKNPDAVKRFLDKRVIFNADTKAEIIKERRQKFLETHKSTLNTNIVKLRVQISDLTQNTEQYRLEIETLKAESAEISQSIKDNKSGLEALNWEIKSLGFSQAH